jgi:tetratricopeptide (TPR) repeat protein
LYDTSLKYYNKSCDLAPYVLDFNLKLADAYFNLKMFELAQKKYEYVINEFSKNEVAYCNLAYILMSKGDMQGAMNKLRIAREINPRHIQTLLNMTSCHMFANNINLAKQSLLEILEIDSNNSRANYLLDQIK